MNVSHGNADEAGGRLLPGIALTFYLHSHPGAVCLVDCNPTTQSRA